MKFISLASHLAPTTHATSALEASAPRASFLAFSRPLRARDDAPRVRVTLKDCVRLQLARFERSRISKD
jgi:hypothetical protein